MSESGRIFKRASVVAYLVLLHGVAFYFILKDFGFVVPLTQQSQNAANQAIHVKTPEPPVSDLTTPLIAASATPTQILVVMTTPSNSLSLVIPVAGVTASQLTDTFDQARSGGRVHDAIDIPAPAGTAVVAAADGSIAKFFDSEFGGITIYQFSEDKNFVFYYSHLQRRSDTLREGDRVRRGETIGFVGDTGNAGSGNNHLHFAIWRVTDPKSFWSGANINPYPLLRDALPLPRK